MIPGRGVGNVPGWGNRSSRGPRVAARGRPAVAEPYIEEEARGRKKGSVAEDKGMRAVTASRVTPPIRARWAGDSGSRKTGGEGPGALSARVTSVADGAGKGPQWRYVSKVTNNAGALIFSEAQVGEAGSNGVSKGLNCAA